LRCISRKAACLRRCTRIEHRSSFASAASHLGSGVYAQAIGDAHILNNPINDQGANAASFAARTLAEAILDGGPFDASFCRKVEARIWDYSRAAMTHELLLRIYAFIEESLPDPDLTPNRIAAAHHISSRSLFQLFEPRRVGVAGWIKRRLLEYCRRDLAVRGTGGSQ
jgi:hypothetical protein